MNSSMSPAIMVANRRKKQRPGTHRSRRAEFIIMEAPFRVVLNWILSPKTELTARQKAWVAHTLCQHCCIPKQEHPEEHRKGAKVRMQSHIWSSYI